MKKISGKVDFHGTVVAYLFKNVIKRKNQNNVFGILLALFLNEVH